MKKTVIITAGAAVLIIALLLGGFPLFSRMVYGRSQAATVFAWQLRKEAYTTEEAFQEHLAQKRAENSLPYILPQEATFTVDVNGRMYEDMAYFTLNPSNTPQTLLFYFPGGSYTDQPRLVHWQFLDKLAAETGATIIVPVYPKLPLADAETAYALLTDFYGDIMAETDCGRLLFMGDSAGGGLALSFAMQLRAAGIDGPEELILLSPWVDVTMSNPDIPAYDKKDSALDATMLAHLGTLWAGELDPTDPIVSPLYGSFEDLGRVTLVYSRSENLYPDITALCAALKAAGTEYTTYIEKGMFHVWPLYVAYDIPETQAAFAYIAAAVAG